MKRIGFVNVKRRSTLNEQMTAVSPNVPSADHHYNMVRSTKVWKKLDSNFTISRLTKRYAMHTMCKNNKSFAVKLHCG